MQYIRCQRCWRPIHPAYQYCWRCLQRILGGEAANLTPAAGTPERCAAAPAVPGAGEVSYLYVAVTRKGSLTNETQQGIGA